MVTAEQEKRGGDEYSLGTGHTPNENKMSDGGRGRVSLGVEVWKSSQKWRVQRSAVRSIAWLDRWREFRGNFRTCESVNCEASQDSADGDANTRNPSKDERSPPPPPRRQKESEAKKNADERDCESDEHAERHPLDARELHLARRLRLKNAKQKPADVPSDQQRIDDIADREKCEESSHDLTRTR